MFALGLLAATVVRARGGIGLGCACVAGFGGILALLAMVADDTAATLDLPLGPPGQVIHLALDPLAAGLMCLLFIAGAAIGVVAEETEKRAATGAACLPLCMAGLGLAVLAADGFGLAIGLAVAGAALWSASQPGTGRMVRLVIGLLGAGGLFLALDLLSPVSGGGFAAIRATPPDATKAAAGFLCALLATAALVGLLPIDRCLARDTDESRPPAIALVAGALVPVVLGILLRVAVELTGPAPPLWWALLPLILGGATAVAGAWQAVQEAGIDTAVAAITRRQAGLAIMALGLVLLAKAADLPNLEALAVGAMLLLLAAQAVCGTLVALTAAFIRQAAGTRQLDRLGGLIHFMPLTTGALLAGLVGLAALPPAAGFASFYLLFQSILAAPRAVGLAPALTFAAAALVLALTGALGVAAMVRLFGVACLGRPRTPRASAAQEAPRPMRAALLTLAGVSALLGLFPGGVLWLLADPAIRQLTGTELGSRAGFLHLSATIDAPGYAPLPLAAVIALCFGLVFWLQRRRAAQPGDILPAWQDGFAPPPAWMPFGDPLTQSTGAGFLPSLGLGRRGTRATRLPEMRLPVRLRVGLRRAPLALLGLYTLVLAVLVCLGAT